MASRPPSQAWRAASPHALCVSSTRRTMPSTQPRNLRCFSPSLRRVSWMPGERTARGGRRGESCPEINPVPPAGWKKFPISAKCRRIKEKEKRGLAWQQCTWTRWKLFDCSLVMLRILIPAPGPLAAGGSGVGGERVPLDCEIGSGTVHLFKPTASERENGKLQIKL